MLTNKPAKSYVCIDLKSFYASVECVDRGLDPLTENLVVADPDRGPGTICLAITPAMKALGVKTVAAFFRFPMESNTPWQRHVWPAIWKYRRRSTLYICDT